MQAGNLLSPFFIRDNLDTAGDPMDRLLLHLDTVEGFIMQDVTNKRVIGAATIDRPCHLDAGLDDCTFIHSLATLPEHEGSRLGREFIRYIASLAIDAGNTELAIGARLPSLDVTPGLDTYYELGFTLQEEELVANPAEVLKA